MKSVLKNTKFIFVFDGGISLAIKKIYPEYKANRNSKRSSGVFDGDVKKLYDYNCMLLYNFFTLLNEIVIPSNCVCNEADFVIGYILKNIQLVNNNIKSLVISKDKDYLLMFNERTHVIYKYISPTVRSNFLIKNFDCIGEILDFPYLRNIKELIFYKALMGDTGDNINKPFGIKTKVVIENFFTNCCMEDIEITYDSIVNYFRDKFKKENLVIRFEKEFRRNLFLVNVFNDEVIIDHDKFKLNNIIETILYPDNNKIEINLLKSFIADYGLYFHDEEFTKLFDFLIG